MNDLFTAEEMLIGEALRVLDRLTGNGIMEFCHVPQDGAELFLLYHSYVSREVMDGMVNHCLESHNGHDCDAYNGAIMVRDFLSEIDRARIETDSL